MKSIIDISNTFDEHVEFYQSKKIDTAFPGFYDDAEFIAIERSDSNFLNTYASFIIKRAYSDDYIQWAKNVISETAEALWKELKSEGTGGRCVEVSMICSRILEKLGIWNFIVKGSLTITLPSIANIPKQYFHSVSMKEKFDAGHAWLVAPPFFVVDLTIACQRYSFKATQYLPDYILAQETEAAPLQPEDIFEAEIMAFIEAQGGKKNKIISSYLPHLPFFANVFIPRKFISNGVEFKYTPTAIGAPDMPLETLPKSLNGKKPIELYQEIHRRVN